LGTADNTLGFREIKKKDWISEETCTKIKKQKNIKMMSNRLKGEAKALNYWKDIG
jgi:hypothetical protein